MSQRQLSDRDIEREWQFRECARSFPHFFANYWTVADAKSGALIRPEVREAQMAAAQAMQDERRLIIVKARQIGWTTLCSAYMFWTAYFAPGKETLALSKREDPEARDIIRKIGFGYDSLPLWFRAKGPKVVHRTLAKMAFSNRSYCDSDASSEDPARGRTLAFLLLDEFGKFGNPANAWQSALPATEHGKCFVIGNANGWGTYFHTQYLQAKAGQSSFRPMFFDWRAGGETRTDEWLAHETLGWPKALIAAEYPNNDEECWLLAGSPRFDIAALRAMPRVEGMRCDLDGEMPIPSPTGRLTIFQLPSFGRKYVIGIDTAGGGEGSDFSVAQVLDVATGKHVAEFHARLDVDSFAFELSKLYHLYNKAFMTPERNNEYGVALIMGLLNHGVRNIYRERKFGYRQGAPNSERYGFQTTTDTKNMALEAMWTALQKGDVVSGSHEYLTEMEEYQYLANGTTGGAKNDDRVMAMAMAVVGRKFVHVPVGKSPVEEPDPNEDRVTAEGAIMPITFKDYVEGPMHSARGENKAQRRYGPSRFSIAPNVGRRYR